MADEKKLLLARGANQAKQLHPDITLRTYFKDIKYFLFGTDDTTPIENENSVPPGGIRAATKNGKLLPQSETIIRVNGKQNSKFTVPNLDTFDFNETNVGDTYFFPSDLVRILTGLARIFREGDGTNVFNADELSAYEGDDTDLRFVRLWGQKYLTKKHIENDAIIEKRFEDDITVLKIEELLQAVVRAAIEYEQTYKKLDTTDFEPKSELENQIIEDLVPKILEKYDDYQEKVKPLIGSDLKFRDSSEKISERIKKLIRNDQVSFFIPLYSGENKKTFAKLEIYDSSTESFLINTRASDGLTGILQLVSNEHPEYKNFSEAAALNFLNQYSSQLTKEFIDPLFSESQPDQTAEDSDKPEDRDTGEAGIIEEIIFTSPVDKETFFKKILEVVTKEAIRNFEEEFSPQYNSQFTNLKDKLPASYLTPITAAVKKLVEESVTSQLEIEIAELESLEQQNLYIDEKFNPEILDSDWYKELIQQSVDFIIGFPSPDPQYRSYFIYLFETHITPLFSELEPQADEDDVSEDTDTTTPEETPAEEEKPDEIQTAVVPPDISVAPQVEEIQTQTGEISRLSSEEIRQLQYESAWMYNRAIYELFTAHGLDQSDIDPALLRELQASVFNYTNSMRTDNLEDFNKLFGSSSYRQKALLEFYKEFNNSKGVLLTNFYTNLATQPAWEKLNPKQQQALIESAQTYFVATKILNPTELLNKTLKESLNFDSPVLSENIKNTVDSLIIQYGLNQPYFAFDPETQTVTKLSGTNTHDIIWFIENVPADRLALIFNLPPGLVGENEVLIQNLKAALKEYARYRASELSLHIQNISLQKGLVKISAEDAEKIKNGDEKTITKHLSFTNDIRDMSKKHGSDTVAGALDEKPNSHRKEIQKQYKTFVPLWNQLLGWEQAEIYLSFGLPIPAEYLTNGKPDRKKLEIAQLVFIPEFVFFDVTKLEKIQKIVERNNLTEAEQAELLEILAIQNQLIREKELAALLNEDYQNDSDSSELVEMREFSGTDVSEQSYRETFEIDQEIQDGGSSEYDYNEVGPGRRGLIPRFLDSKQGKKLKERFGRRFKKKLSPTEKSSRAFNKAASGALSKLAAGASNLIIPGSGVALMAIKNKKLRNIISTAILGGFAWLIGRTIWALGSIGGAIGGVIGGVVGYVVSGGTMVIPGVIIGANIGEAILPQRWWGFWEKPAAPVNPSVASSSVIAAKPAATVLNVMNSTAGIGVIAVGGHTLMALFLTLFVIMTIQSAFLIPVPKQRTSFGGAPVLGSFGCFELGPAGHPKTIGSPPMTITSIDWSASDLATFEAGFQIVASNRNYMNLLCSNGPITVYRFPESTQGYWGWVTGPTEMILYGGAFGSTAGMEYVLIHETGHIIHGRNPGVMSSFLQTRTDNSCYTYPFPEACNPGEAFAEGLVLYVTSDFFFGNRTWSGPYPFYSNYPAEYNWFKNNVFGGQEF